MRTIAVAALLAAVPLSPSGASAQETRTDVPQTFRIELGGFRVASNTELRLSGSRPGDDLDFERDLQLPGVTTTAYIEGFWQAGRRHQLSLNWTGIKREGDPVTLEREIQWGDEVFQIGTVVRGTSDIDFVSGAYRFSLFKNEQFDIGPAIGIGYLKVTAGVRGQVRANGDLTLDIDEEGSFGSITGDLGGYLYWWPGKRVLVRGDLRYIFVSFESSEGEVAEGRVAITWFPWRQVGIGAQYSYTKFRYDRDLLITALGGTYQYDGIQLLGSVAF